MGVVAGPPDPSRSRRAYPGFVVLVVAAALTVATVLGRSLMGGIPVALTLLPLLPVAAVWLTRRLTHSDTDLSVPVHRFRLQRADGRTGHVLIEGEIPARSLNPGDVVRIHSEGERDGHTVAGSVDVLATLGGPVVRQVTGRPPAAVAAARVLSWISIALAAVSVAFAATVLVS